jgi:cysteinyl-tRNA synthetase
MKSFKFFDSVENKLVEFKPSNPKQVLLYTCGPTVYNFAHIGNFRTYMFEDILKRALLYFGYGVKHVMNITDIDDKTIKGALEKKVSLKDFTEVYTKAFFEDLESLHIIKADVLPKATDYIPQMIDMIKTLINQKHAYIGPDASVYFSLESFPSYGKLSHLEKKTLVAGASARVSADEYDKENPSDFVLWKAYDEKRDGDIYWDSPFGKGRPGWHIECSAMASSILGKTIDIHCGGIDNMFPHHENEIAQCEACHKLPFSRYWLHSQHLLVEGKKMSKSLGNFFTLRDLTAKGYSSRAIRYVLLSGHYKMPLNFTLEGLDAAKSALSRIDSLVDRLKNEDNEDSDHVIDISSHLELFDEAVLDDLNTPKALSALFEMIRAVNAGIDKMPLSKKEASRILSALQKFDEVLSFIFHKEDKIPDFIMELAEKRKEAKKNKNFQESDRLRGEIKDHGFLVEDTPQGFRVTKL